MEQTYKYAGYEYFRLEGEIILHGNLIDVKTSKTTKKKMIEEIRKGLNFTQNNPLFNDLKKEELDVAIVVFVNDLRNKKQDVDNIAKVVLDAIKNQKFILKIIII